MERSNLAFADYRARGASGAEEERLNALKAYAVLDTEPEQAFDRITRLVAQTFRVPIVLISLLDEHRQWFKSRCGLEAAETPREISFCDHAIRQSRVMVVPDAMLDERFAENPLVTGEPGIRFYAGAPLSSPEGLKIGTLCIIDRTPRSFGKQDCDTLASFAGLVMHELNVRLALGSRYAAVTEGERTIKHVAKLEAALGALLRNNIDAIIAADGQGCIVAWNRGAEEMFGYRAEEMVGQLLTGVLSERSRLLGIEGIAERLEGGQVGTLGQLVETEGIRRDGARFPIEVSLGSWQAGQEIMSGAIIRDISERKRAEGALRAARDRAQIANRAKTEFLANMSHELRTPLNAIIGCSEFLTMGVAGPLAPKQAEYVEMIHGSGKRLLGVFNDVLDYSNLEVGRFDLRVEGVKPETILKSCAALVQHRADEREVVLAVEAEPDLHTIQADPSRLKQALISVLSNALKFSPRAGRVSAQVRRGGEDGATFLISDQGCGMTAAEIATALEPFSQVDGGLARKHEGAGLGLPLAVRLVELHGGSLRIDSQPGRGTTVVVTIPTEMRA